MSTRRARVPSAAVATRLSAGLLTCVLALTLATVTRSSSGQHHLARAEAAVGAVTSDLHNPIARLDQHAVADPAAAYENAEGVSTSTSDPVAPLDARRADTPRVRGPPGRAA